MKKLIKRLLFTIMLIMIIGVLIIPVIVSLFIWTFTNKGLMWIVKLIDWVQKI